MAKSKLLAVNDDPSILRTLLQVLQSSGEYDVEVAETSERALHLFNLSLDFNLVITAMTLPDGRGFDLIRTWRDDGFDVPTIFLTNSDDVSLSISAINSIGEARFINSNHLRENLLSAVEALLTKRKTQSLSRQQLVDIAKMKMELEQTVDHLTNIGKALSAEKDFQKLLEEIVLHARDITAADACTLYLLEGNCLHFKIVQYASIGIIMGGRSDIPIRFAPLDLAESDVTGYVALRGETIVIDDVYQSDSFDFSPTKKFDSIMGYRSKSMLVVPMRNHEDEIIGVWQLMNARDATSNKTISFSPIARRLAESVASQAAVAVTNMSLIKDMQNLFESFVQVMATAIDEKSPVTGGHIKRVAHLTLTLAEVINEQQEGRFKDVHFGQEKMNELRIAAWLHDIGKVTTPLEIIEKGKKLETVFNRIIFVDLRLRHIAKLIEIDGYKLKFEMMEQKAPKEEIEAVEKDVCQKLVVLEDIRDFVWHCNEPNEFMENSKLERLKKIKELTYKDASGKEWPYLTDEELKYLSIRKGSITEEERLIIQNHAAVTVKMLNKIPFTRNLKNIPKFAGAHHERPNGTGYPLGLKGDEIPFEGLLMAVTDIAEALTAADRPYKKAMPLANVHSILREMAKKDELDKDIVELFINGKVYERYENRSA
jgi:HD-GYP domain-containing protein (c-di-GMP phosphodiesterase class II)/DNA-binding response OmpR family regulator